MKEFCKAHNITERQFTGLDKIEGDLYLYSLTSIPKGFNPVVGGGLYLRYLTSIPSGFNPVVGGDLFLNSLTSIPKGFNPVVGGYLHLDSLTSIPKGFNPVVGGGLYLRSLTSIPKGFNPVVGGSLNLGSLTSIPKGFNPVVGGGLYLKDHRVETTNKPTLISWQDGRYISVDSMFTEVVSKHKNVWKVKKLHQDKEFYLVSDGEKYAHGDTIAKAKADLIYKIGNRDESMYKNLTKDSVLKFEDAISCYRVFTRACAAGVRDFVESNNIEHRSYKISEIIELTKGAYNSELFKTKIL